MLLELSSCIMYEVYNKWGAVMSVELHALSVLLLNFFVFHLEFIEDGFNVITLLAYANRIILYIYIITKCYV